MREAVAKQLERIIADTDALPAEKREEAACKLHEKPALRKWMRLTVGGKLRDGAERVPRHGTRPARDRAHALIDPDTGKVASAKQPRKWARLFEFGSAYVEPPGNGDSPPVRITFPDGTLATSDGRGLDELLSRALGRRVTFTAAAS